MSSDDVIIINDGQFMDPDVAVICDNEFVLNNTQTIDTIVIDEDKADQNDDVIEIIDIGKSNNLHAYLNIFDRIVEENKPLSEFIEKCLDIEHSEAMLRVINKSLLPIYESVSDDYKTSPEFQKLIYAKLRAVEVDPKHKFSHLKDMCETMKCHRKRKKVEFVTLSTDVKDNRKRRKRSAKRKKKSKATDLIEVPIEYEPDPVIDLDEESTDVITLEDSQVIENENMIETESNKENNNDRNINNNPEFIEVPVLNFGVNFDNHFLVPQKSMEVIGMTEDVLDQRIKSIESRIASYKKEIERLELLEVDVDTINSPYIRCESFKSQIVKMYKELCSLMGAQAVKRREVRLQVTDGRPELPVKKLEKLINDNIGEDGNPHFPDFCEVVECVAQANNEANLGFTQAQITTEARRLFTNCGLALQQKRQKRDWRDMLGRVDYKVDDDPADADPALFARLEENRRVGLKKEVDLLDTFAKMEYSRLKSGTTNGCNGIQITEEHSGESDDEIESNAPQRNKELDVTQYIHHTNSEVGATSSHINTQEILNETSGPQKEKKTDENISDKDGKLITQLGNVEKIQVLNITILNEEENSRETIETNENINEINRELATRINDGNKEVPSETHHTGLTQKGNVSSTADNEEINMLAQNIKSEPRDTLKEMAQFGDNFTATIIYIEDPYLIIEISSDSSDDESDCDQKSDKSDEL